MVGEFWAVLYCPKQSVMLQCHLNNELCVFRACIIRQLFKNVCKGSNRDTVEIAQGKQRYEKIGHFQDGHFVAASKALQRMFRFEIVDKHSTVARLDAHHKNRHKSIFEKGNNSNLQIFLDLTLKIQTSLLPIASSWAQ